MKRRRTIALVVLSLGAACSPVPPMPDVPPSHPASPQADEAPERAPNRTLVMPEKKPATGTGAPMRGH